MFKAFSHSSFQVIQIISIPYMMRCMIDKHIHKMDGKRP